MTAPVLEILLGGDDGEAIVSVRGEVDVVTVGQLRAVLQPLAVAGPGRIVVDVSEVSFIDSTGLGVLVGALERTRGRGAELVLRGPGASTRKILEITGLDVVFAVVDGER